MIHEQISFIIYLRCLCGVTEVKQHMKHLCTVKCKLWIWSWGPHQREAGRGSGERERERTKKEILSSFWKRNWRSHKLPLPVVIFDHLLYFPLINSYFCLILFSSTIMFSFLNSAYLSRMWPNFGWWSRWEFYEHCLLKIKDMGEVWFI